LVVYGMSRKLLPVGTILNRYRIEGIIGEGGFGVTYRALEPVHQEYVAIKEYFPKLYANRGSDNTITPNRAIEYQRIFKWGLKRFLDEARVLARLDHPNIIVIKKYFELHGTAYLVMEYCEGKPLDRFVDEDAGVSPRRIFQIFTALINALEHVHQHGIIHGDLKPSNILVRTDGIPVLLDFGSARQELFRIAVGQVSDGYSPPEFYSSSDKIGPWSDIYGLGATFYKLITGMKVPVATDRAVSDTYAGSTMLIKDGYSLKFLEMIESSLKLTASERPQTISSLRRMLPDSGEFSNRKQLVKHLIGEAAAREYTHQSTFTWKPAVILLTAVILGIIIYFFVNQSAEKLSQPEVSKVAPVLIDNEPIAIELSGVCLKNNVGKQGCVDARSIGSKPMSSPLNNSTLQQAVSYVAGLSSTPQISWYSIPETELATRALKLVMIEIDKQFATAIERKTYTFNNSDYFFKNMNLYEIKTITFTATDSKCNYRSIGPTAIICNRVGRDFKCRFLEFVGKYENICLSAFSL